MRKIEPLLVIVSSPSGAGKTTLCRKLLREFADLRFSISHTTREPRPNEIDGQDYHFVSNDEFDKMVENDLFIEWAKVHGNRYGTARAEVSAAANQGNDLIFDVDFQGARQITDKYHGAVRVFVLPPSIEELKRRLRSRGTENPESLKTRFEAALLEIAHHGIFDYLIVNDKLDVAYDQLRSIVVAERVRHSRMAHVAKEMLEI